MRKTLSTDAIFSPVTYPSLRDGRTDHGAERARVQGHSAGYAAGRREAAAEAEIAQATLVAEHRRAAQANRAEVESAIRALEVSAGHYSLALVPVLEAVDAAITSAAIALAEVIIGRELASTADSARVAIERVLTLAATSDVRSARLNPADLAVIEASGAAPTSIVLVADPTLDRGDSIIERAHGIIDARISTAVNRARAAVTGEQS
jgi:flagellar assembly protein FliH